MDGVTQRELDLLIAGEIKCVGWPRPHCQHIYSSDWAPHTLSPNDLRQRVHHVPVVCPWLWVKALHTSLNTKVSFIDISWADTILHYLSREESDAHRLEWVR